MAKNDLAFFRHEFNRLAVNGVIGDPNGEPAYAYIRVSTDDQGDEGRSGLPRQIAHVHERAREDGFCIAWERVYAEDYTGFKLERPELNRLFVEIKSKQRAAHNIVIEHIDRLSRNAEWHQGWLHEQFEKLRVKVVYWQYYGSKTIRSFVGIMSQANAEQFKERTLYGTRSKAKDGRVTAKIPAYGYRFVDDNGAEGDRARRFTYYAPDEPGASIMRGIYADLIQGQTLNQIAKTLIARGIKTPSGKDYWRPSNIAKMVKNPVYKGVFIANREYSVEVDKLADDGITPITVIERHQRPEDEWERIPIKEPLVDEFTWQLANERLKDNQKTSRRNAKEEYLLSGRLVCASCGYAYTGLSRIVNKNTGRRQKYYRCIEKQTRQVHSDNRCTQGTISCLRLDKAVWQAVVDVLMQPEQLLAELETMLHGDQNLRLQEQMQFIESELQRIKIEGERMVAAYRAGFVELDELGAFRDSARQQETKHVKTLSELRSRMITPEQFESQRQQVLALAESVRQIDGILDPPFDLKRQIVRLVTDKIIFNQQEGWFEIHGAIRGLFHLTECQIVNSPASRRR